MRLRKTLRLAPGAFRFRSLISSSAPFDPNKAREQAQRQLQREETERQKRNVTLLGLASNVTLSAAKFGIGIPMNSSALIADAIHQASDAISDVIAIGSLHLAARRADATQPFGYGHFDTIGSLALGLSLIGAGVASGYLACYDIYQSGRVSAMKSAQQISTYLSQRSPPTPLDGVPSLTDFLHGWDASSVDPYVQLAVASIVVTIMSKEYLYQRTMQLGKKTKSNLLIASAWHHRTDSLSSVVAGIGIAGSYGGLPLLDPLSALIVNGMIIRAGAEVSYDAVGDLTDRQTSDDHKDVLEKIQNISKRLSKTTELISVHDIHLRRMGGVRIVDLHAVVDYHLSTTASYQVGQRLKMAIMEEIPEVTEVFVHVDAGEDAFLKRQGENLMYKEDSDYDERYHPLPKSHYQIEAEIREVVQGMNRDVPFVLGVSHVNVHYVIREENQPARAVVEVNLLVELQDPRLRLREVDEAGQRIRRELLNKIEDLDSVDIHVQLT